MKNKIFVFSNYYLPGYKAGGPIRSISNIVEQLGDAYDFYIFTTDRDAFESNSYKNIEINSWNNVGKAKVFYAKDSSVNIFKIVRILDQNFDYLYLNSFFNFKFSVYPILALLFLRKSLNKVVLAPRGEFSHGALKLKNHKKSLFISLFKLLGLYKKIRWQASSNFEKQDILRIFKIPDKSVVVAPNITTKFRDRCFSTEHWKPPLKVVFLSRISKKKNLDYALRVIKKFKKELKLNIYGIVDDRNYWRECLVIIKELPPNIQVEYHGVVDHDKVCDCIMGHDLFFLPTKGENFGHAIVESLSVGVPVLISDTTPWRNLRDASVGWDVSLNNKDEFLNILEKYYTNLKEDKRLPAVTISEWIRKKMDLKEIINQNEKLFNDYSK